MTTDNIFVYLFYQFPVVLMVAYSVSRGSDAQRTGQAQITET